MVSSSLRIAITSRWRQTDGQRGVLEMALRPLQRENNRSRPCTTRYPCCTARSQCSAMVHSGLRCMPSSSVPDLPPELTVVDSRGSIRPRATPSGQPPASAGQAESRWGSWGCCLLGRQERGFAVAHTNRRDTTGIVAIASGASLALAVSVGSASLLELRLLEAVLAGCFLDETYVLLRSSGWC